jgi:hypothetical protein
MFLFEYSPYLIAAGVLLAGVGVSVSEKPYLPIAEDPEEANRRLTMKVRQPFRYRAMMLLGLPGTTRKH